MRKLRIRRRRSPAKWIDSAFALRRSGGRSIKLAADGERQCLFTSEGKNEKAEGVVRRGVGCRTICRRPQVLAQTNFPQREVTIVVSYNPGGASDADVAHYRQGHGG